MAMLFLLRFLSGLRLGAGGELEEDDDEEGSLLDSSYELCCGLPWVGSVL